MGEGCLCNFSRHLSSVSEEPLRLGVCGPAARLGEARGPSSVRLAGTALPLCLCASDALGVEDPLGHGVFVFPELLLREYLLLLLLLLWGGRGDHPRWLQRVLLL